MISETPLLMANQQLVKQVTGFFLSPIIASEIFEEIKEILTKRFSSPMKEAYNTSSTSLKKPPFNIITGNDFPLVTMK